MGSFLGLDIANMQDTPRINPQILDWPLSLQLAGNNTSLAKDILTYIVKNINKDLAELKHTYQQNNLKNFLQLIHRLHGGLRYCGVPTLRKSVAAIEATLKDHPLDYIAPSLSALTIEANNVIEAARSIGVTIE